MADFKANDRSGVRLIRLQARKGALRLRTAGTRLDETPFGRFDAVNRISVIITQGSANHALFMTQPAAIADTNDEPGKAILEKSM